MTITSAPAIAIGTVPDGVMRLAKRTVTTMFMNKLLTTGVAAGLVVAMMAMGAAFTPIKLANKALRPHKPRRRPKDRGRPKMTPMMAF